MHLCPLCSSNQTQFYFKDKNRSYFQCSRCELVFVPEEQRLNAKSEKAHYDQHENNPDDQGYRRFLSRLSLPLLERIESDSAGLDFGCGPGPALAHVLREAGHKVALYDIYYQPDTDVLKKTYDFVTATEVIEHLYDPKNIWSQWLSLVKPGGWIGIMTKQVIDLEAFSRWHYKNDPTHVSFFSQATFRYLAKRDKLELEFIGNDVVLLRKPLS
ncbi:2-polyprenyl-3-methyl-5-hydroxy-6-metoxy-1,4-benzoquinol methylase [Psychromonas sp. MB-3u-54]|uniref:class I SAM-dependent methyltransferase n=1 Tax=Psychromonas sp. MB-3u-54 TaxID=2058319 RepID=UPI000C341FD9|nr:class I SAM-dependent methyltransferase [Psychromonas sp. MB-3u-54]PKH04408.1 2-polyprenyl-3-methyl-5-hydroxy-6-metoxy-1,4-benzoquinol methylase [Psychromonas sp. MB-3u-54]